MQEKYSQGVTELVPGIKNEPAFKSRKEYEEFRLRFQKAIEPDIKRYAKARANSELAAMSHWVD